jgi:hypothetical protein
MYDIEKVSALVETFESKEGTHKVYENGLLESFINEGAYIDVPYLLEGKKLVESLMPGKKVFVISEGRGHFRISRAARTLSADKEYSSHIQAIAIIINHSAVKLIFELYHKINKPAVPTKSFTDRTQGYKWLNEMMSEARLKAE